MTTMITSRLLASAFDQCTESCGWIAAFIAALAYGTFGVPIKESKSVDVHPFVLQSYKTCVMFLLSWLVVPLGESVKFTPWGLLSGLLWVMGGTGGVYGIRNAGMAVAVGTWSSVMILVNFLVGIVFFQEPVASFFSTCGAFLCLAIGLVGMSIYSAPVSTPGSHSSSSSNLSESNNPLMNDIRNENSNNLQEVEFPPIVVSVPSADPSFSADGNKSQGVKVRATPTRSTSQEDLDAKGASNDDLTSTHYDPLRDPVEANDEEADGLWRDDRQKRERGIFILGKRFTFTKRELGVLGAVVNGVFTGSSLVPIHYAKQQGFAGAAYFISFATGALLSNVVLWIIWFGTKMVMSQRDGGIFSIINLKNTYEGMPPLHFRQLYIPGFSAGVLLTIAMFGSIMSVTYLGQGVGNSIIQSKILISGLWGIFWYREIVGGMTIAKWFLSASITITGILWLSYERIHGQTVAAHHF